MDIAQDILEGDIVIDSEDDRFDIEDLLKRMLVCISHTCTKTARSNSDEATPEVLFDIPFQGARYTLTCTYPQQVHPYVALSPREQEIVRLVAKGLANKTIAEVLDISPWTVATHLRRVFGKLNVNSRAEMVARVLEDNPLACHH